MHITNYKKLLVGIFTLITVAMVVFIVFLFIQPRTSQPTPTQIPKTSLVNLALTPIPQQPGFNNAKYIVDINQVLPTNIAIYGLDPNPLTSVESASIAKKFGFSGQPQLIANNYVWQTQNPNALIEISPQSRFINYINNSASVKPDGIDDAAFINVPEKIIPKAKQLLKARGINVKDYPIDNSATSYLISYSERPEFTSDFKKANVFMVGFTQTAGGVKIYKQFGEVSNIIIVFDRLSTVRQITYYSYDIKKTPEGQFTLITTAELKTTLGNGEGFIRQPFYVPTPIQAEQQATFTLSRVEMGYLAEAEQQALKPIFVSTGTVTYGTSTLDAVIYAPAIR